jgi:hypothetical protein
VKSGGLRASYYPNQWFSPRAEPYLARVDAEINFSWGSDEDIIPGIARERVSVEWRGYLAPGSTGEHEFFVEADDGVRLFVNGALVIDSMVDVLDEADGPRRLTSAETVALTAG